MILLDGRIGSVELLPYVNRCKVEADVGHLEFGDAAFEGNGPPDPDGGPTKILIGVERKKIGDLLNCIDDARYAAHQRPGMMQMYQKNFLFVEGVWKPDTQTGYLMQCIDALTWRPFRQRTQMTRYSKLFRYLLSVSMSGVVVIQTRDIEHTAFNICEIYQYFRKKWDDHTSLIEIQKLAIPALMGAPSLVRKWASDIDGIGVKYSQMAEQIFRTPIALAKSDESQWLRINGLGVKTARQIVRDIWGVKG